MSAPPLLISAVILGNGSEPTACVRSLLAGTVTPQDIVLVTPSPEWAGQAIEHAPINRVHVQSGASWAEACKLGLGRATGGLIAVLDAGCEVQANWLELLASFLDTHPDSAAVEGKRTRRPDGAAPFAHPRYAGHVEVDTVALTWTVQADSPDRTREVACLSRQAFLVRSSALQGLGASPLDSRFQTELGANDLFAGLLERDWHLYYLGQAEVYCAEASIESRDKKTDVAYLRDLLLFAWKHLSDERRDQMVASLSKQAYLSIRNLLTPASPSVCAAREALAWIHEQKRELSAERAASSAKHGAYQTAVDAAQSRARYSFHLRQELLDLVPNTAKFVIDVGCASGMLGSAIKRQRLGVQVRGVELSSDAAARAREVLDDVYCGSAENPLPSTWPNPDCVIFGDILEHLQDPWHVLRYYRTLMSTGDKVVVSVPNIGHRSVLAGLLRGKFDYVDAGILDRTHLRFFTRASAIALLESSGFKVEQVMGSEDGPKPRWLQLAQRLRVPSALVKDLQVVQFLIVARVP
jgi:2-polyprenyl-3-methyl-5-hydroxy-6-metoxy-1,4-benzoquinol methylase